MKFKPHQVPEEGLHLEGQTSPSILEISEPVYRFEQPIQYKLDITWMDTDNLLVRGSLSTVVKACCVRTLEWFEIPIETHEFTCELESKSGDEVDLTPMVREDILLLLPANPVLEKAKPFDETHPPGPPSGNMAWGKLDELKLKKS